MEIVKGARPSYEQILREGQGLKGENFSRNVNGTTFQAVDGTIYGMLLPFRTGDIVTNLHVFVSTAGADCTVSYVGLYDVATSVRLVQSAELTTAWQTAGLKTHAMSAPYTIPTTGVYRAALISKATTTQPIFLRAGAGGQSTSPSGGALLAVAQTTQTALVTPATFSAGTYQYWVGWS